MICRELGSSDKLDLERRGPLPGVCMLLGMPARACASGSVPEVVLLGGALGGTPAGDNPCPDADGDSAGTMGIPAMATGIFGELANNDIAAARGVLMPSVFTGEPKATGPYEDELHRGVLPAFELVTEALLLIALPLGVLAGVMNGEKPPPACPVNQVLR